MKLKKITVCAACLFIAAAIVYRPERYIASTLQGILLWAECVAPSLFPFMVIIGILVKTGIAEGASRPLNGLAGKLKLPACAPACFLMSAASGYPAGSRMVEEFYEAGATDKAGAKKLALLCSTSGPLFIIGSVGVKMFSDQAAGIKIFCAHLFSVFAVALIYALFTKPCEGKRTLPRKRNDNLLNDCFYGAVASVLTAGAFIVFFYTAAQIVYDFQLLLPLNKLLNLFLPQSVSEGICRGLVEATGGCCVMAHDGGRIAVAAAGFIITFGGASILLQQLCYLIKAGISPIFFIAVKFIQAALCAGILLVIP